MPASSGSCSYTTRAAPGTYELCFYGSAAGDQGYGASYPATSAGVIAVGGTNLVKSGSSRGWAETVWNDGSGGTGSGCSASIAKPAGRSPTR